MSGTSSDVVWVLSEPELIAVECPKPGAPVHACGGTVIAADEDDEDEDGDDRRSPKSKPAITDDDDDDDGEKGTEMPLPVEGPVFVAPIGIEAGGGAKVGDTCAWSPDGDSDIVELESEAQSDGEADDGDESEDDDQDRFAKEDVASVSVVGPLEALFVL